MAIVSGDPRAAGPFVFRFEMPAKYWICPHTHPVQASIRVISGDLIVGMGPTMQVQTVNMYHGNETVTIAAGTAHFEGTVGGAVIEVRGEGPWGITFLDPLKDPGASGATQCTMSP